uniref:G protein-coupled receptor n=1 Tax=Ditylenchus dipsaci TaxID=166011 RepID=A0A915CUT0_9BILA
MLFVSAVLSVACVYLADLSTHPKNVEPPTKFSFTRYWTDLLGQTDDGTPPIDLSFIAVPTAPEWSINCAFAIFFEMLCYSVIAFCGYRISKAMQKLRELSHKRVVEANRQLTIVLLLQSSLPLMAILVNATCLLATYNNKSTLSFMVYLFMPLYWQPVASPLITILTIRSFRNYVLKRRRISSSTNYTQHSSKCDNSKIKTLNSA